MSSGNDYGKVFAMNSLEDVKRELGSSDKSIVLFACEGFEEDACRVFEELSTQFRSIKFLSFRMEQDYLMEDEKVEVIKKIHELIEDNGNGWPTYFVKGLAWPIFAVYEQWTGIVSKSNSWLNAEELKDLVEELAER